MSKKICFHVGKENIIGSILGNRTKQLSDFIFFHGAGKSNKERVHGFFDESVFAAVPSIVTFDFSGHGESSGELKRGSLRQRVLEAAAALDLYTTKKRLTICASSMGGYVAFKMLATHDIKNLILFAPAVYDRKALETPFDKGFSEVIRQANSWRQSDAFDSLKEFTGNLLLFIGKQDEVIPSEVIDLLDSHSPKAAKKDIIRFDGCSHNTHAWLGDHPAEKKMVAKKILEYYLS